MATQKSKTLFGKLKFTHDSAGGYSMGSPSSSSPTNATSSAPVRLPGGAAQAARDARRDRHG